MTCFRDILNKEEIEAVLADFCKVNDSKQTAEEFLQATPSNFVELSAKTLFAGPNPFLSEDEYESEDEYDNNPIPTYADMLNEINAKWLPYLSVKNGTRVSAKGRSFLKIWDSSTKIFRTETEIDNVIIEPGSVGQFPLPKTFDAHRDYPHNHLLNDRYIQLDYDDGREILVNCSRMNQGHIKHSVLVQDGDNGKLSVCDIQEIRPEDRELSQVTDKMVLFLRYCCFLDPSKASKITQVCQEGFEAKLLNLLSELDMAALAKSWQVELDSLEQL